MIALLVRAWIEWIVITFLLVGLVALVGFGCMLIFLGGKALWCRFSER